MAGTEERLTVMSIQFKVNVKGDKKIDKKLKTVSKGIKGRQVRRGLLRSVAAVEGKAKQKAPVGADGQLRKSITGDVQRKGLGMVGRVGTKMKYAAAVEFGTDEHWPPSSALERWVRLKLKVPRNKVKSVAFLIARRIAGKSPSGAKGGTKPQPYLGPALIESRAFINRTLRRAVAGLLK